MACRYVKRLVIGLLLPALAASIALSSAALPVSVFVVHCEPTKANPAMWLALVDLVSLADQYAVPLSIDFTAQWAEMILDDSSKLTLVEAWLGHGHEVGCHHHGYWGTKAHGSTWDGYSNTPLADIAEEDRHLFRGTMEDYMTLLDALPGERRSGCMGLANLADFVDYPCQLAYSTQGHALEHGITVPEAVDIDGCSITEIGHALIATQERGALQELYEQTGEGVVFGVNGHVYNYAELPLQFEVWFSYLAALDEAGTRRGTVSDVLDAWTRTQ